MKITWKNYFRFATVIVAISFISLICIHLFFYNTTFINEEVSTHPNYGIAYAVLIIKNNLLNFLQYTILFIFSPVFIIFDVLSTVFQVYVSVRSKGSAETGMLLYKHGIIEIPNIILYMLLSFKTCICFLKNKNLKSIIGFWRTNIHVYMLSLVLIILAGFIEGMIK